MNRQCFSVTIHYLRSRSTTLHTDASGTAPPDAFGPFRVLHQIGVGVLGPVYRAYQPDPGRLVAVKQFRLDLPPENAHRFVAALERLIAADLTHLGIAAPLATGMTENSPYLALDFVAAESFDVVIRDYGPTPVTEAVRIATQLGGALDFAAAVNVFHGALHPRDVLVSADETRVTGLGVAQALDALGVAAPVRRPYTSPERVSGATWDRRADVFSLAAMVFEVLFGRRVVGVGTFAADAITPIAGSDMAGLRALFTKALAENPEERFDTALAFAEALRAALQQSEPAPRPARSRRRRESPPPPALPLELDLPLILAADGPAPPSAAPEPEAMLAVGGPGESAKLDRVGGPVLPDLPVRPDPLDLPVRPGPPDPPATSLTDVALEQSRSAVWPIVLALVVGLMVGFAGGYGIANRDRGVPGTDVALPPEAEPTLASSLPPAPASVAEATTPSPAAAVPARAATVTAPAPQSGSQPSPAQPASASASQASSTPPAARPRAVAPPRPAPPKGRLTIRSTPAGARVSVDGRAVGVTPLTVDALAAGTRVVRIAHQGYVTAQRRVRIGSTQTAQSIEVALEATRPARPAAMPRPAPDQTSGLPAEARGAKVGSLMVDSRPAGARVFVDGKMVGTTPMLLDAVATGEHSVRLERDGFSPWTSTTTVSGGERTRVSGSLEQR